jgi:4-amino-4-deoxy-L-arabinose transferase-like glycosyltransferase
LLSFLAGVGVWLAPMLVAVRASGDPALSSYAGEILFRQTGTRYANAWHHVKPAWYYLQVIATLWLPGALLLPWLLPAWRRRLRRGDARLILLLGWVLLVLLFFTASAGKREVYIFPALPALCMAAGPLLPGLLRRRGVRNLLFAYLCALAMAACALSLIALTGNHGWAHKLAEQRAIEEQTLRIFALWLLAFGVFALGLSWAAAWSGRQRTGLMLVLATAGLWTTYGLGLAPALDADSSASGLMQRVGWRIGPTAELGMVAWREQNLLQADRPAVDFGFKRAWREQWEDAGPWLAADPSHRWLFVLRQAVSPCVDPRQVVAIGQSNRNDWVLVPGTAWRRGCVTPEFGANSGDAR